MWKYLIFFLAFFISKTSFGQQTQQLTHNSYIDNFPDIYECRIVWSAGIDVFPSNHIREIFLSENGSIKQLTFGGGYNYDQKVGSHYVTWKRKHLPKDRNSSIPGTEIWCYDGKDNRLIFLNSTEYYNTEYYNLQTAGKYIAWTGYTPQGEKKAYLYNGQETEILPVNLPNTNSRSALLLSDAGVVINALSSDGRRQIFYYDFKDYKIIAEQKGDTNVHCEGLSGSTVLIGKSHPSLPEKYLYYLYKDGKSKFIEGSENITSVKHFDSAHIVWIERIQSPLNYKLYAWKDDRNYFLSQEPFSTTHLHPELSGLRFVLNGVTRVLYYNGKLITDISIPGKDHFQPVISKGKVVWFATDHSVDLRVPSGIPLNTSEIYLYNESDEINCKPVSHLDEDLQKSYYDANNRNIQLEFFGKENVKYNFALYDLRGRLILNQDITLSFGLNSIPVSTIDLSQGIYLMRLNNLTEVDKSITKKLFIAR